MSQIYDKYAETRPHHHAPEASEDLFVGKEHVFNKLFRPLLPVEKDAAILDIGCGYGEFLFYLQNAGYSNARGIDLSRRQIDTGRALGVLNLGCEDAWNFLSSRNQSFEFISAIDVLEHIPKRGVIEFLELVRRALSPGGIFVCQVPNLAAFYTPLFYMDITHETPFTASSLKQALQIAGFEKTVVSPMGPIVHGPKSAVRYVLWKSITMGLRFLQTIEGGPRTSSDSIYTAAIYAAAITR